MLFQIDFLVSPNFYEREKGERERRERKERGKGERERREGKEREKGERERREKGEGERRKE